MVFYVLNKRNQNFFFKYIRYFLFLFLLNNGVLAIKIQKEQKEFQKNLKSINLCGFPFSSFFFSSSSSTFPLNPSSVSAFYFSFPKKFFSKSFIFWPKLQNVKNMQKKKSCITCFFVSCNPSPSWLFFFVYSSFFTPDLSTKRSLSTRLNMSRKVGFRYRGANRRRFFKGMERNKKMQAEWKKNPPIVKWWSSGKGLHPWLGKRYAMNLQSKRVNWAMPYKKLDTPFYGSNTVFITKAKKSFVYDIKSPFIKANNHSRRRKFRTRIYQKNGLISYSGNAHEKEEKKTQEKEQKKTQEKEIDDQQNHGGIFMYMKNSTRRERMIFKHQKLREIKKKKEEKKKINFLAIPNQLNRKTN